MTVRLGVVPLKIPRLAVQALDAQVRQEMTYTGTQMRNYLNQTTSTWKGPKPTFNLWMPKEQGRIMLTVYPAGNALGVKKWRWLDEGTRVRRALMSRDWVSKTGPVTGKLGSFGAVGHGRGKLIFVSRKLKRPGIKARGWSKALAKHYEKAFPDRINNALRSWAQARAWQSW